MIFPENIPIGTHWKRIHVIFARHTYKAVIFVRGPNKYTQQIAWNIETSEFSYGQSLAGQLYTDRCDLSPLGTYLIYFVGKYYHKDPKYQRFTAISCPPTFTAITLWPVRSSWYGGGFFIDEKKICLYHPADEHKTHNHHPNALFDVVTYTEKFLPHTPQVISGWRKVADFHLERTHSHMPYLLTVHYTLSNIFAPNSKTYYLTRLRDNLCIELPGVYWADFDQKGYLIMARFGQLLQCDLSKKPLQSSLLVDFNHNQD